MSFADVFGGFFAGIIGTTIGYPLDTIKTRMQTGGTHGLYRTGLNIASKEGLGAFYKGVGTPLVSLTILSTLNFTAYNSFKRALTPTASTQAFSPIAVFGAGVLCGPVAAVFSTPEHVLKTLMQVDNTRERPRFTGGSLGAAKIIVNEGGFKALYVGGFSNLVRESTFLSVYFLSYETLKLNLNSYTNLGPFCIPVSGGLAGALGWFISYPLDCIKSNIMVEGRGKIVEVGKEILSKKGVMGLYSGLGPSIARSFLVSGSRFSAYELGSSFYRRTVLGENM
jgi:solute carrier family 25 carnitine/acylcarnitine transporter 20/29